MPDPIVTLIGFFILNLVLKRFASKNESQPEKKLGQDVQPTSSSPRKRNFGELIRSFEEQFEQERAVVVKKEEPKVIVQPKQSVRREGTPSQTREATIRRQEEKINKHSELELSRRLHKDALLRSSRLSESQVPLAQQVSKGKMDDFDLSRKQEVRIETTQLDKSKSETSGLINIKKDILKGIIYSEILSKPKSLEK